LATRSRFRNISQFSHENQRVSCASSLKKAMLSGRTSAGLTNGEIEKGVTAKTAEGFWQRKQRIADLRLKVQSSKSQCLDQCRILRQLSLTHKLLLNFAASGSGRGIRRRFHHLTAMRSSHLLDDLCKYFEKRKVKRGCFLNGFRSD
jgi:hypothetical protein